MPKNSDEKIVFALAPDPVTGGVTIILGITEAAWRYMADGKTHTVDLAKAGLNVSFVLFGAKDHDDVMEKLTPGLTPDTIEARHLDWSMKRGGVE